MDASWWSNNLSSTTEHVTEFEPALTLIQSMIFIIGGQTLSSTTMWISVLWMGCCYPQGCCFPQVHSVSKSLHPIVSQGSRASPVKTGVCPAVSPLCIPTFPSIPYPLHLGWQVTTYIPRKKRKKRREKNRNGVTSGVLQSAATLDFPHLC